jgi:hypothetical protein
MPILESGKGNHNSAGDINDSWNADDQTQQLLFGLRVLTEKSSNFVPDQGADSRRGGGRMGKGNFRSSEFVSIQISQKKTNEICANLCADHTSALGSEAKDVGRPAAGGVALADRRYQAGGGKVSDHVGNGWRAQAGRSNQVSLRARADLTQEMQYDQGIRMPKQRGPAEQNGLFRQWGIANQGL